MSIFIQKGGLGLLSRRIIDDNVKLDTLYIEFGPSDYEPGVRDTAYFKNLEGKRGHGFVKIAVENSFIDQSGTIQFSSVVGGHDLPKNFPAKGSKASCVTLASSGKGGTEDTFVCTQSFKSPVVLLKNAYNVIRVGLKFGE